MKRTIKHLFIPDCQIKPEVSLNHLNALGHYIVKKQPDVIIQAGDFADMHSLSTYDKGRLAGEGARYERDLEAAHRGMETLFAPIKEYNKRQATYKKRQYYPRLILTLGNHENRIVRHVENYPLLQGRLDTTNLNYESYGWEVHDFLQSVEAHGITYCHYFPRNAQGRIVQTYRGAPSAAIQVQREARSCTSGHLQGLDIHFQQRADRIDIGLIAGSFYQHDEDYLGPQGTAYWRGVIMKNEVWKGTYDPMMVSIKYLLSNYWDGNEYVA